MSTVRLWQIRNSVFSEKARWALDFKGVEYERRDLVPGFHPLVLVLRRRGATVPVVDLAGHSIRGSAAINAALEAAYPDPPLYPHGQRERSEARALERRFDPVGHEVRRLGLAPVLHDPALMELAFWPDRRRWQRVLARASRPLAPLTTRRLYGVDPPRLAGARVHVEEALQEVERRIGGSRYLVDERFTVADLTAAALLAPIVQPDEYPDAPWHLAEVPSELARLRDELASRPGGAWVLEMYRRHRR